jgi:GTP-binding protein
MSTLSADKIRNIAIIAHVDHGKTTLMDNLIRQTLEIRNVSSLGDLIMDSMDQEKERGITIKAKNASLYYKDYKINVVDTPGHADFGGEVERTLRMVDGALILVDAQEGPMPQTKYVLKKAIQMGLKILVIINKVDKPAADCPATLSKIEDLFLDLEANDEQMDFPIIYASGFHGKAGESPSELEDKLYYLLDQVIKHVPKPVVTSIGENEPFKLLTLSLHYDSYKGKMAVGKISQGKAFRNMSIVGIKENSEISGRVTSLLVFDGLGVKEVEEAEAGEIVMIAGLDQIEIGDTITIADNTTALPRVQIDDPTMKITIGVNTSPLAGQDGKLGTSRQIRDRLYKELETNVALRVEIHPESSEKFIVSGRGELHLAVLIEAMRREGFEMEVSRPEVIFKTKEEAERINLKTTEKIL